MEIDEHLKYTLLVNLLHHFFGSPTDIIQPTIRPLPPSGRTHGIEAHTRLFPLIDFIFVLREAIGLAENGVCNRTGLSPT